MTIDAVMSPASSPATVIAPERPSPPPAPQPMAPIELASPPLDPWHPDDHFPLRAHQQITRLRLVTPHPSSSNTSSMGSSLDLVGPADRSQAPSPIESQRSSLFSLDTVSDIMAEKIECIIARQRLGQHAFGNVQVMCQELFAHAQDDREALVKLLCCADLNLPLFSLLTGDRGTFELLNAHNLAFLGRNHSVYQVYAKIQQAESPALCDYYDAEIAPHVTHRHVDRLDLPRHVLAFVRALCSRNDARFLVYLCQSTTSAVHCALLGDDVDLAARVMAEPQPARRMMFSATSNGSSPAP